jgi:hypothetical protein
LHWSLDPPKSRQDVIEAIERGDMRAGSWRMKVGRDEWRGDTRHVHEIAELRDVTVVGAEEPAYGEAARVEYRTHNEGGSAARKEGGMPPQNEDGAAEDRSVENQDQNQNESTESSSTSVPVTTTSSTTRPAGSLRVEDRVQRAPTGLADEFRAAGFPGEVAEIPWSAYEERAVTWTPSINLLNQVDREGAALGFDQRYVWSTLPRVGVDAGVTSVQVLAQSSRTIPASGVVRPIAATTDKAEVTTTINLTTVPLSGVAAVESGIANVVMESPQITSLVEGDLALTTNEGIDGIVNATFAASGFQAPGTDNALVSYRKCITQLRASGYSPDVLVLTPAADEALDVMTSGLTGGTADFIWPPGSFGPGVIFGLRRVVSKVVSNPVVFDSTAYGRLYASPARLARFEENDGKSNTSLIRLELHCACGVERQAAAIRVAAS